jgi:methylated-DNA-[protein]-cysteine S-methyltransferase
MTKYELLKDYWESPIGVIEIAASLAGLNSVKFIPDGKKIPKTKTKSNHIIIQTKKQLKEYFTKKRTSFDLEFDVGGTDFQLKVLDEVKKIPFGQTITYTQLAKRLGNINLSRAVGAVNGKNQIWIIIPCHRVVGMGGELVGYAGGLWRKQWLLEHESSVKNLF